MRANHCYFALFSFYFCYTRAYKVFWIRALYVPVPGLLCMCNVHPMGFGAIRFIFRSNETCFSSSPATTCSGNLTIYVFGLLLLLFFSFDSVCTCKGSCRCLAFSIFELKNKNVFNSFAQWIWTKSLHLQRREPADCWPVMRVCCFYFEKFIFHSLCVCFVSPEVRGGSGRGIYLHMEYHLQRPPRARTLWQAAPDIRRQTKAIYNKYKNLIEQNIWASERQSWLDVCCAWCLAKTACFDKLPAPAHTFIILADCWYAHAGAC